jgi:hypothetical protein
MQRALITGSVSASPMLRGGSNEAAGTDCACPEPGDGAPLAARRSGATAGGDVGFLDATSLLRWFDAFQNALKELGYVPGQTIAIERRVGSPARLADLAAELVRLQPKVIVVSSSRAQCLSRPASTPRSSGGILFLRCR